MKSALPRVVLVEDDLVLRDDILAPGLREAGFDVTGVGNAAQLHQCLDNGSFGIVVLDVGLPDADGCDVARRLRSESPIGIVLLTGRASDADRLRGLGAGADIYLAKPILVDVLVASLRNLSLRLRPSPSPAQHWGLGADGWELIVPGGQRIDLSASERAVLRRLFESVGAEVSRADLIAGLTDNEDTFDPRRLEMTVYRLRRKIEMATAAAFPLRAIRSKGYLLALDRD